MAVKANFVVTGTKIVTCDMTGLTEVKTITRKWGLLCLAEAWAELSASEGWQCTIEEL